MAQKTRLELQIEASMKRIQQEQNRLKELESEQKTRDDNARTNRLCKRHGLLESFLPITIGFTDEQYEKFVRQHITNKHGIAALATITGQTVEAVNAAIEEAKEQKFNKKATAKAAKPAAIATTPADTKTDAPPKNGTPPAPTAAGQKPETQQPKNTPQNSGTPVNSQAATA